METNTDLVVQMHMQRTGKLESVRPTIGLYFTDRPPARNPFLLGLVCEVIDIPPGETTYLIERNFDLPTDVEVLAVLPHAHFLADELQAYATLPDGARKWLLLIKHWDFAWQDEYRYAQPVFLPKGSSITMRYTYNNSSGNPRNPHRPPRRVTFGPQSTDEMGELWLQVLANNSEDLASLAQEQRIWALRESVAYFENQLRTRPDDAVAHNGLAKALGPLGREAEALKHFETAASLDPNLFEPHYYLGLILLNQQRLDRARMEFEQALRLNPEHAKSHTGLGLVTLAHGDPDKASEHFQRALRLNPDERVAGEKLKEISEKPRSAE
jgi:tetratricopeptide (TPR) repeat protein